MERQILFLLLLLCGGIHCCSRRSRSSKPRDTQAPSIICPQDIRTHADPVQTSAWITWNDPVVTDNKDGTNVKAELCSRGPNERYYGRNLITYRARDRAGNTAKCSFKVDVFVLHCDSPPRIDNGYYHFYPSNDFRYGGTATYGCYPGYQTTENRVLECQVSETWSSAAPSCEKVRCSAEVLSGVILHGKVECTDQNKYQSKCHYTCDEGYRIKPGQSSIRVCGHLRQWLGIQPTCVDTQPPIIHNCPSSKIYYTDKGKSTATVIWYEPYVTDNSDESITVTLAQGEIQPSYDVGSHRFEYTAEDSAGNKARPCKFTISVRRLTCHTIYPTPGLLVTCEDGFGYGASCQFDCEGGLILSGSSEVECKLAGHRHLVRWFWGNSQPICKGETCPALNTPANGAVACDNWAHGRFCKMFCNDQFVVPRPEFGVMKGLFACGDDGQWRPRNTLPDCLDERRPNGFSKGFDLHFFSGDCCDPSVTLDIQQKFIEALDEYSLCTRAGAECHVDNIRVSCDGDQCEHSKKKKRSVNNFDLHLEGTMTYEPNGEDVDYETANEILKEGADNLAHFNTSLAVNMTLELQSMADYKTEVLCEEGLHPTPYDTGCAGCESGSYYDLDSEKCEFCPIGSYNDGSQTTECLTCPAHTNTSSIGSKTLADCIDYCPPGKYSAHGTVPCTPCPVGSYSDVVQSTQCTQCPHAMTTSTEGSSALDQCQYYSISIIPSLNGSFGLIENITLPRTDLYISLKAMISSSKSLNPLFTIQDGEEEIISIAIANDAIVSVTSVGLNISGEELKQDNWNLFSIYLAISPVTSIKAIVNGKVFESSLEVTIPQFTSPVIVIGSQTAIQESFELTEINLWSDLTPEELANATDSCASSFEGDILSWNSVPLLMETYDAFINVPIICDVSDQCWNKPCGNHTCIDGINSFTCECSAGFTGDLCDENIDDCASHACENEATCMDGVNSYSCVCTAGFTGEFCENIIVDGGWGEWSEWSTCTETCNTGTQARSRSCDQPQPGPDGADCSGESTAQQTCNEQECVRCVQLEAPDNGYLDCEYNETSDLNTCTQHCNDGFAFPDEPLDSYLCGYETGFVWNNVTRLQCTEIEAPTSVVLEYSVSYTMPCNEETVAALQSKFTTEAELGCVQSGLCTFTRIDIVGDGCPIHVTGMSDIRVDLIVSIQIPELISGPKTGVEVLSELSDEADEVIAGFHLLYQSIENDMFTVSVGDMDYPVTNQTVAPIITCQSPGYVWIDYYCVPCQIGTFGLDYTCYECPVGTYQDDIGHSDCIKCPTGLTTTSIGSVSQSQCSVSPREDDVCASFDTQNTNTEAGWLCRETDIIVYSQYLTAENFTDVFPRIAVHSSEGQLLGACVDTKAECIVTVNEENLQSVNTYTVAASVPASDVTCVKTVTVYYRGLSSNGVMLVVFMVILALAITAFGVAGVTFWMYRARKKVQAMKPSQNKMKYEIPQKP